MELRQLRYFLTVLRLGSINRAATVLNVTQPSLSHSIKALERSVGAELIIRGGGGVRATAIGEEFAIYANNIVREAEKAKSVVETMRGAGEDRIALGVLSAFSMQLVPKIISEFFATTQKPLVDVFVYTSSFDEVARRILRAEWDLVLTLSAGTSAYPPEIGARFLGLVESSVYCGARHPLAGKKGVTLSDMAEFQWVASNLGLTDRLLAERFAGEKTIPSVCLRSDSMALIPALLGAFPFLCMAPDITVADDIRSGALVRVDQDILTSQSQLMVLYSNLSQRTPAARALMAVMASQAKAAGARAR